MAARHERGQWAMIYPAEKASFSVNMDRAAGTGVNAVWVNPKTGDAVPAGAFPNSGQRSFSTPDGWEDALLVLEGAASPSCPAYGGGCRSLTAWNC